jgi:transposase
MLALSSFCHYYLYRHATDMRRGFDSLCGLVRDELKRDPLNGAIYIFFNRRRNQVKLLLWEKDGFSIYYKRLEKGTYEIPFADSSHTLHINCQELSLILHGISLRSVRRRVRFENTL